MRREITHSVPRPIDGARTALVRDIMTHHPVTARPDTGLEQVIELFVARELSHLPVVDDDGKAIGMISKTDVVRNAYLRGDTEVDQARTAQPGGGYLAPSAHIHEADDLARDVMTPIALWVPETASIAEAAHVMSSGQLHALVVADATGHVVGILSAVDIVAWVAGVASGPARARPR